MLQSRWREEGRVAGLRYFQERKIFCEVGVKNKSALRVHAGTHQLCRHIFDEGGEVGKGIWGDLP